MARIVADDAIAWLEPAFGCFGEIVAVPGREITAAVLRGADALLTRSVTRVDEALLDGATLRFVGSCTAGIDHVDVPLLERRGIAFAFAPGSNARGVAEYVLTALHALRSEEPAAGGPCRVAVVGFGEIGRRLTVRLRALGHTVRVCDPPLARRVAGGDTGSPTHADLARAETYLDLASAVSDASVLTVHVPLMRDGAHPTAHLINAAVLDCLADDAILLQTSRGGVVDDDALQDWLARGRGRAVVDVWEHEPALRPDLVDAVAIATPHVAGYTLEGKARATAMVHAGLADWLQRPRSFEARTVLAPAAPERSEGRTDKPTSGALLRVQPRHGETPRQTLARCLLAAHPIDRDDAALRTTMTLPEPDRGAAFEALRRGYRFRRELSHYHIAPARQPQLPVEVTTALARLGLGIA